MIFLVLGLLLGFLLTFMLYQVFPLYPSDTRSLIKTLKGKHPLLIIDDGLGRLHLLAAKLEDGFLKTKEHNFAAGAEGTTYTLGRARAALAYVNYGGTLNLGVVKASEKIGDAIESHGDRALNPGIAIKLPPLAMVNPNRVERILHESVSGRALKQLEIAAEIRGRAGLTDWGKWSMIFVFVLIGAALAIYIMNLGSGQGGAGLPAIPIPGGGGIG